MQSLTSCILRNLPLNSGHDHFCRKIVRPIRVGSDIANIGCRYVRTRGTHPLISNLEKAGQELAQNPEFGPNTIAPLKMQRVDNFGQYGIEIITKMTCIPGGQWEVRPKIYPLIKKLFEENGIEFARPTVKVSGSPSDNNAAAGTVEVKRARSQPEQ